MHCGQTMDCMVCPAGIHWSGMVCPVSGYEVAVVCFGDGPRGRHKQAFSVPKRVKRVRPNQQVNSGTIAACGFV
jgi:hypothetical protein